MWTNVRLELAQTPDFPRGSASRAYLLRLPLDAEGRIDEPELRKNPEDAICRRFWPGEREARGRVVPARGDWMLRLENAAGDERSIVCHLAGTPLILGARIAISQADGEHLPFRVARINELLPA